MNLNKLMPNFSPIDLAKTLTLALLFYKAAKGDYEWFVKVPMIIGILAWFIRSELIRSVKYWSFLSFLLLLHILTGWYRIDNHDFLTFYWTLTILIHLSLPSSTAIPTTRQSASLLIGLSMAFAVIWKLISPDFIDGSFFEYQLLRDDRFLAFSKILGKYDHTTYLNNKQELQQLTRGQLGFALLNSTPQIRTLSVFLTYWTLFIEIIIGILFIIYSFTGYKIKILSHFALITFITTTYSVATVTPFGWLLSILGLSTLKKNQIYLGLSYLFCVILLIIYTVPFSKIIHSFSVS